MDILTFNAQQTRQVPEEHRKPFFNQNWLECLHEVKNICQSDVAYDLSLKQILTAIRQYYKRETVEIVEWPVQQDTKGVVEYIAEIKKLGKTCSFVKYLNTALYDQLV